MALMMSSRWRPATSILSSRSRCWRGRAVPTQQVAEPQDGVHRGADLVAHVGEKGRLGPGGRLGPIAGLLQLQGARRDQLLETATMSLQFLGQSPLLGDVLLDPYVVSRLAARRMDGRDCRDLPIDLAVLAPIDEFAVPRLTLAQGVPQLPVGLLGREAGLQEPGVLADDLALGIARRLLEGAVHIGDARRHVGNHDCHRTLLDGERQCPQTRLRAAALDRAPDQIGDQLNGLDVLLRIVARLVADPGEHDHSPLLDHRNRDQSFQPGVTGRQAAHVGGGRIIVEDDGRTLA